MDLLAAPAMLCSLPHPALRPCSAPLAPQVGMSLACGSAAGLVSSTATFPLDLVRRRLQLHGQGGSSTAAAAAGGGSVVPAATFRSVLSGVVQVRACCLTAVHLLPIWVWLCMHAMVLACRALGMDRLPWHLKQSKVWHLNADLSSHSVLPCRRRRAFEGCTPASFQSITRCAAQCAAGAWAAAEAGMLVPPLWESAAEPRALICSSVGAAAPELCVPFALVPAMHCWPSLSRHAPVWPGSSMLGCRPIHAPQVIPGVAIAFMTYELAKKTFGVTTNATER